MKFVHKNKSRFKICMGYLSNVSWFYFENFNINFLMIRINAVITQSFIKINCVKAFYTTKECCNSPSFKHII